MTTASAFSIAVTCILLVCVALRADATVSEDPHVHSWDGVSSTVFHEGDFILANSRATGLAIHGRFCKASRGPWAPWTCALAVRCTATSPLVEIVAADFARTPLSDTVERVSPQALRVSCPSLGLTALVMAHRFHRHPYLNVQMALSRNLSHNDIQGLVGTPNGDKSDDLSFRTGGALDMPLGAHLIGHSSSDVDAVHLSWLARPDEALFSSKFTPKGSIVPASRRPHLMAEQLQRAEHYCSKSGLVEAVDLAICAYDLLTVGHVEGSVQLAAFRAAAREFL